MDPVEGTLSKLSKTHFVLFVASIAVLVAAVPGQDYDASMQETRLLRDLMFEVPSGIMGRPYFGIASICTDPSLTDHASLVGEAFEAASPERPVRFGLVFEDRSWPSVICPYPESNATLEEWATFIGGRVRIEVARPRPEALATFLARTIEELPDLAPGGLRVMWLGTGEYPEVTRELPDGARQDSVVVSLTHSVGFNRGSTIVTILPASEHGTVLRPEGVFRSHGFTPLLRIPGSNRGALPVLQASPFWDEISTLPIAEAVRYVQSLARDEEASMEVLGFRINAQVLGWAGPPLLVVLLVHLLLHAQHLQRVGPKNPELVGDFPWLPLFADPSAQFSAAFSICVLPPAAAGLVAWRLLELSQLTAAWAGLMALLSVSLGVRTVITLRTVRSTLRAGH